MEMVKERVIEHESGKGVQSEPSTANSRAADKPRQIKIGGQAAAQAFFKISSGAIKKGTQSLGNGIVSQKNGLVRL